MSEQTHLGDMAAKHTERDGHCFGCNPEYGNVHWPCDASVFYEAFQISERENERRLATIRVLWSLVEQDWPGTFDDIILTHGHGSEDDITTAVEVMAVALATEPREREEGQ